MVMNLDAQVTTREAAPWTLPSPSVLQPIRQKSYRLNPPAQPEPHGSPPTREHWLSDQAPHPSPQSIPGELCLDSLYT